MSDTPKLNPLFRLQFEKAQNCHVLLYPEGMVKLSESAGEILLLVDGKRSNDDIILSLQERFPDAKDIIKDDVDAFLTEAEANNWIVYE